MATRANGNVVRGCGDSRVQGAVYIETGLSDDGLPLEAFICDPPIPYSAPSSRGVHVKHHGDITYIIDEISFENYPYPSDFLEEVRRHGLSRKVSPDAIAGKLSENTFVMLVHRRGILKNAKRLAPYLDDDKLKSRCKIFSFDHDEAHLQNPHIPCSRHTYSVAAEDSHNTTRTFTRDTSYSVVPWKTQPRVKPEFQSAVIAKLPVTFISVITADDGSHEKAMEKIKDVPVAKGFSAI
jgi:hypothetical protein